MAITVTATVPVITATALSGAQFLGYVCAITVPAGAAGSNSLFDSGGNPFEEWINFGAELTVAATATGTNTGASQSLGSHLGAQVLFNIVSIAASCTARVNIQSQDSVSGNWTTMFTMSVDNSLLPVAPASPVGEFVCQLYPGAVAPAANAGANLFIAGIAPGNPIRTVVSITATNSGGGAANINYAVNIQGMP